MGAGSLAARGSASRAKRAARLTGPGAGCHSAAAVSDEHDKSATPAEAGREPNDAEERGSARDHGTPRSPAPPDAPTAPAIPPTVPATPATAPTTATLGDAQPTDATSADDVARKAGRGGLAVAGAKIYFILIGLIQQVALPQIIGAGAYGALSRVLSMASIAYNPVVTTSIQGVSRAVAQTPEHEQAAALRRVLKVHAALAVLSGVGFAAASPFIARATGAPHIITALLIVSGVFLFYGLYTPLVGALNGKKLFLRQAGLDATFATLRTIGLVGGGYWFAQRFGMGVEGANAGFVAASALIFLVALRMVGIGREGSGGPSAREHILFIAPLLLGQVLLNLLLQADLQLVGYFASEAATAQGMAPTAADPLVGAYRASQLFCFLPYQLLIAVMFIIFPLLASAHRDGDRGAVARYVRTGVRLAALLAGVMVSVTSGLSGQLLDLVFPGTGYSGYATQSMQVLTLGFAGFAIFGILTTILNSLKHERISMLLTAVAVGLVVAVSFALVPGTPFGADVLLRTAVSTTAGLFAATVTTAVAVKRVAGGVMPALSLVRIVFAMGLAIATGRVLPNAGKLATIGFSVVVALVYIAVLLVTRELKKSDLQMVQSVVARRKKPAGRQ